MTYSPQASRKGGSRKHLCEEVIKQVESVKRNATSAYSAFLAIEAAVVKFKKEMGK